MKLNGKEGINMFLRDWKVQEMRVVWLLKDIILIFILDCFNTIYFTFKTK